jgi:predicted ester cyclase
VARHRRHEKIQFKGIVIWRFADGRIVERWASVDPPR